MPADKRMNVLIIDDYQTMRGVIRNLFNQLGFHNTFEAATTDEAARLLKEKGPFGLVVFDWHTGPADGGDFLAAVRSEEKTKNVPFILVSSESGKEQTEAMKKAGAADFMAKPFTKETLRKKMAGLFGDI